MHPMTQLAIGVSALNKDSIFAAAYDKGIKKTEYWEPTYEDAITLMAKLPALAARIYRNTYFPEKAVPAVDANLDLVGNYANMMGVGGNEGLTEYMRLYIALHGDHEGGNVSAHAARKCFARDIPASLITVADLVGSALSDPYLSYSAALLGLAGPLHGLANQEAARFVLGMQEAVGNTPSQDQIKDYLWNTLNGGRVIPGCVVAFKLQVFVIVLTCIKSVTAMVRSAHRTLASWRSRSSRHRGQTSVIAPSSVLSSICTRSRRVCSLSMAKSVGIADVGDKPLIL